MVEIQILLIMELSSPLAIKRSFCQDRCSTYKCNIDTMNTAFSGLPFLFAKEELETDFEVNFSYYGYRKIPKISPGVYIFQRPF